MSATEELTAQLRGWFSVARIVLGDPETSGILLGAFLTIYRENGFTKEEFLASVNKMWDTAVLIDLARATANASGTTKETKH